MSLSTPSAAHLCGQPGQTFNGCALLAVEQPRLECLAHATHEGEEVVGVVAEGPQQRRQVGHLRRGRRWGVM